MVSGALPCPSSSPWSNYEMEYHSVCELFPMMSESEHQPLTGDIRRNGLKEEIWTYEGKIIDGRDREKACRAAEVTARYRGWDGRGSLVEFVWSLNGSRRHLESSQLAAIAATTLPNDPASETDRETTEWGGL
jgi:hypothetical protein